jgi:hypothetical protein
MPRSYPRAPFRTRVSNAAHPATVAQSKELDKMRAGMQSGKANPTNESAKQASKADRSFNNLKDYRPLWGSAKRGHRAARA